MFNKLLFGCTLFLLVSTSVFAQNRTIEGVVTDNATGETLVSVTVQVEGTTRGVTTDVNGEYSIEAASGETLVFSYIGYITQYVVIDNQVVINVAMEEDIASLEELVITAYGNQKKKAVTGAVSTINKNLIEARPLTTFQSALQGTVAGVSVSSTTGQPGAGSSLQIRGAGSLNASNAPLYVVDGVPVINVDATGTGPQSVLNTINPSDIESISVLKDASASALYGSRAANGVVLINTKRGQRGTVQINVRAQTGFSDLAVEQHETLNALEYYRLYWQEYYDTNVGAGQSAENAATAANASTINLFSVGTTNPVNPFTSDNPLGPDGQLRAGVGMLYDTDWLDETISRGVNNEFDLNVSGGNESTRFYISTNIFDQEGILPGSDFSRGSVRLNLDTEINDFLDISIRSNNVVTEQNSAQTGGGANNPFRFANLTSNIYSFYARGANNEILVDPVTGRNLYNYETPTVLDFHPVGLAELDRFLNETQRSSNTIVLNAELMDGLQASSNVSLDVLNSKDNTFENGQHGNATVQGARASQDYNRYVTLNLSNQLSYTTNFGSHNVDAIIGQEYFSRHDEFLSAGTNTFVTEQLTELSAGSTLADASSSFSDRRIISYFARMNYGFNDKYFVTASIRRDGASEFGRDNRWGTFGSIGGSWIISEESFMSDLEFLDILKLRASYGTTGNNSIGAYDALGLLGFSSNFDYFGAGGSTYTQLANPELKWEVNTSTDLGIEFEALDNRLAGEFVYWTRTTSDLLFEQPIPVSTAGFSEIQTNLAEMKNSGIEVSLSYRLINTRDLLWSVNANITTINNEITELPVEFVQNGTKRFVVGKDRYQYHIQEFAGVDETTGAPLWYQDVLDTDGNPTGERTTTSNYSQADRYNLGSALEDYFGGFGTSLSYKGLDFQAVFSYKSGGKIYDFTRSAIMHMGSQPGQQLSREVLDAWTADNTNTDVSRFGINNGDNFDNTSSRFLYDGDFVRLKNVTIGYSLNREMLSKVNIRNLRVFVTGENLLTFAAYDGLDPELPRSGNSNNIFPAMRTITAGINLGF